MVTLYDEIAKAEAEINKLEGEDNGTDNDAGVREEHGVQRQDRSIDGEESEQGASKDSKAGRQPKERSGRASSGEGGTSRDDAGTRERSGGKPRSDSKDAQEAVDAARKDGEAPHKDGKDGSAGVRGSEGHDTDSEDGSVKKELTNADWARQRRELRELRAKLAKLESAPAAPVTTREEPKKEEVKAADPVKEPNKEENYQAWLEWKLDQQDLTIKEQTKLTKDYQEWKQQQTQQVEQERLTNAAVEEFTRIEETYKKENADYGPAIDFARQKYMDAAKIFYPDKTEKQIEEAIDKQMLAYAAGYAAKGLNPAEELYDLVVERFGYVKSAAKADNEEEEERPAARQEKKPNLRVIEGNKRRSATPLGTGGQGGSIPITKEMAADMDLGEFSRLTPSDIENLENMG